MSWYVEFTTNSKARAGELIDSHLAQTSDHNPDWQVIAGAMKTLVSLLPEPGKSNVVRVHATGHSTQSKLANSGRTFVSVELVPYSE